MTINALERVMYRLRKRNPGKTYLDSYELKRAIMLECGVHQKTYISNRKALITLGWIKTRRNKIELTDKDITDS